MVSWSSVARATSYTIYDSTTSATTGYSVIVTGATSTSWTSGSLATGNYWFEVVALVGSNWASAHSGATAESTVIGGISCVQP
ncbi:MAG: hypothetical protein JO337_10350 [Acidimicrobiales bacterium]|nr:hypothetical protein [Acidimicrobiales bacterium]